MKNWNWESVYRATDDGLTMNFGENIIPGV